MSLQVDRRALAIVAGAVLVALVLILSIGTSLQAQLREPADDAALVLDTDEDGMPDVLENYAYGTDPTRWNSSSIPVPDSWLLRHGFSPLDARIEEKRQAIPPLAETPAAYGPTGLAAFALPLADVYAANASIDPTRWDETGIGIPTAWLMRYGLDPLAPPPADEPLAGGESGLTLREAYTHNTDPRAADTDGDGLDDAREVRELGTDPSRFSTSRSGVADGWLVRYQLDARDPDAPHRDIAKKGMSVADSYHWSNGTLGLARVLAGEGLDPTRMSTRGGPIPDGWLVKHGLDPLAPGVETRIVDRASSYSGVRDLPGGASAGASASAGDVSCLAVLVDAPNRTVSDCVLTVLDQYAYGRPPFWEEAQHGAWWGGLDPRRADSDSDGLPDAIEMRGWFADVKRTAGAGQKDALLVRAHPLRADSDGDALGDLAEYAGRARVGTAEATFAPTDPMNSDSDYDGLDDRFEVSWALLELPEATRGALALDPTDADTAANELPDGEAYAYWTQRSARYQQNASYEFASSAHRDLSWVRAIHDGAHARLAPSAIASLFAPQGDADADGVPNLLDYSSRGSQLADGWAVKPETLASSSYGAAHPRSATDPANPDTDGDELPDAWELQYGAWDAKLAVWNLDPARWSSFGDETSDAERDLDGDSAKWSSFSVQAGRTTRAEQPFDMSDRQELKFGTHPNRADTSGDGLPDGWKAFWGLVYPSLPATEAGSVYPGAPGALALPTDAPRIDPLGHNDATLATLPYVRFSESTTLQQAAAGLAVNESHSGTRRLTAGGARDVHEIHGRAAWTLKDAHAHGTNPYLLDTDADGTADAWEVLHGLDPLDPADAGGDPDGDGLTNLQEFWGPTARRDLNGGELSLLASLRAATDPRAADSDLGGLPDGLEMLSGLDAVNAGDDAAGGQALDSDCDGISDFQEILGHLSATGARVVTAPRDPDTDRDGLLDGSHRALSTSVLAQRTCLDDMRARGILLQPMDAQGTQWRAYGEGDVGTDPTRPQSLVGSLPDAWAAWAQRVASRSLTPEDLRDAYTTGRPAWWSESAHGPWWWGRAPTQPAATTDRDCNGLADDGEDPFRGARPRGMYRSGNATAWDLDAFGEHVANASTPAEALLRAQSLSERAWEPRDCAGVALAPRASVRLVLDAFDGQPLAANGSLRLEKGREHTLTGRVLSANVDPSRPDAELNAGAGVANVTVLVSVNRASDVVGVAVTDPIGRFSARVALAPDRVFDVPYDGVTVLGRAQDNVSLDVDASLVSPGNRTGGARNELIAWTYATPADAPAGHPQRQSLRAFTPEGIVTARGVQRAPETRANLTVVADALFEHEFESPPFLGEAFNLTIRLVDRAGSPVPDATVLTLIDGVGTSSRATDRDGEIHLRLGPYERATSAPVIARFAGTGFITAAETRIDIPFKARVAVHSIGVHPQTEKPGGVVTVFGTLLANGRAAGGVPVSVPQAANETLTAPDGSFALRVTVPANTPPGLFPIPVATRETQDLSSASAAIGVIVLDPVKLTLKAPTSVDVGSVVRFEGTLVAAGGRAVRGATVALSLDDARVATVTTARDGSFAANVSLATPGIVRVKAAYAGDGEQLAPAEQVARLVVKSATRLAVDPGAPTKGGELALQGRLTDALGRGIGSARVAGTADGSEAWEALTRADGTFAWRKEIPRERATSLMPLVARYDGTADGVHEAASASLVVPVLTPLGLEVDTMALRHGENALTGRVVPLANTPLEPLQGTLRTPSGEVPFATRPDGRFNVTLVVPPSLYEPTVALHVALHGTRVFAAHNETLPLPLDVGTSLQLLEAGAWTLGAPARAAGVVVDEHGLAVPAGAIRIEVAGRAVGETTISDGRFLWTGTLPRDLATGPATLRVVAEPGAPRATATLERAVHVHAPVTLTADREVAMGFARSDAIAFTLRTDDGAPLRHVVVIVRDSETDLPYAVWTDASGEGAAPLSPGSAMRRTVVLEYAGNETTAAATFTAEVVVLAPGGAARGWLWATLAIIVVAGAAIYVIRRRARRVHVAAAQAIEAAEAQLVAGDEYRATIFQLFRMLTHLAKDVGAKPSDSDTAREIALQLRRILPVSRPALRELVGIFERARYDDGAIGPQQREAAVACFREIKAELSRASPPQGETRS